MDADMLALQLQAMRRRIAANIQAASDGATAQELLLKALDELHYALDQLSNAHDALRTNEQALASVHAALEQERQLAADAFNQVPVAYLITGIDSTIKRVNSSAARFLNQTEKFLLGKSLGIFIPEGGRRAFRAELERLRHSTHNEEYMLRLQPNDSRPRDVAAIVGVARDRAGRAIAIHWLLHQVAANQLGLDSAQGYGLVPQ